MKYIVLKTLAISIGYNLEHNEEKYPKSHPFFNPTVKTSTKPETNPKQLEMFPQILHCSSVQTILSDIPLFLTKNYLTVLLEYIDVE